MKYSLKNKIFAKIRLSRRRNVFMRRDFEDLSIDYDQVGRAIRQLVQEGVLLKIGYGLYAKARINSMTGKPMLAAKGGFNQVSKEALKRLNVNWENSINDTNQIPAKAEVIVNDRFSRKIAFNQYQLRVKHL